MGTEVHDSSTTLLTPNFPLPGLPGTLYLQAPVPERESLAS